jgi:hypothetical protein
MLAPLQQPTGYDLYPGLVGTPAHNVAHLYTQVVDAMAGRESEVPTFDYGVELHRTLESITAASQKHA